MLAITVQQPWAWAIIHARPAKNVENRTHIGTWKRAEGQRIAVHAGRRWSDRGARSPVIQSAISSLIAANADDRRFPLGVIIGTATVAEVHWQDDACDPEICTPWGERSYTEHGGRERVNIAHLLLERPRPCDPIPCRGALGLWRVPDDIARELVGLVHR